MFSETVLCSARVLPSSFPPDGVRVLVHALTVTLTGPAHYRANFLFVSDFYDKRFFFSFLVFFGFL
jgi:hypothetical protein